MFAHRSYAVVPDGSIGTECFEVNVVELHKIGNSSVLKALSSAKNGLGIGSAGIRFIADRSGQLTLSVIREDDGLVLHNEAVVNGQYHPKGARLELLCELTAHSEYSGDSFLVAWLLLEESCIGVVISSVKPRLQKGPQFKPVISDQNDVLVFEEQPKDATRPDEVSPSAKPWWRNYATAVTYSTNEKLIVRGGLPGHLTVSTRNGETRLHQLRPDDYVETKGSGFQKVLWVGSSIAPNLMISVPKRALGNTEEISLNATQRLLVQGVDAQIRLGSKQVLVIARDLVGYRDIAYDPCDARKLVYQVLLEKHECFSASGLAVEALTPLDLAQFNAHHELFECPCGLRDAMDARELRTSYPIATRKQALQLVGS